MEGKTTNGFFFLLFLFFFRSHFHTSTHFIILVIDHVSNLLSFFSYFYLFFLSPRHLSKKRSLTLRGSVCARLRFVCFFSFSRKWSVRFFRIHSGLPFCHVDDGSPHTDSLFLWTFFTDPFVYFNMNMFFTNWRNDSAIYSRATVFSSLLYTVSRFLLPLDVCLFFFHLQKCP